MKDKPRFEELLEFPCLFVFRVIAEGGDGLKEACGAMVEETIMRSCDSMENQPSKKGNYQVIRIGVMVVSANEIRDLYTSLHSVTGVRMVL